jgi:spermidine/putrescine transport system permease protein
MFLYLTLQIFMMILYSFNDIPVVGSPRQTPKFWGFTTHWWRDLFGIAGLSDALRTSLIIAPLSAFAATVLGTLVGLALGRYRFRGKAPVNFVIFLAIAVPEIVLGSSLLSMFILAQTPPIGFTTILLSHIGFSIAFVAVTVRARVQGLDAALEDAAQDLFANPITTFFRVTLPLIAPASWGFCSFVLSPTTSSSNFTSAGQNVPGLVFGATRIGLLPGERDGTPLFGAGRCSVGNVMCSGGALLSPFADRARPSPELARERIASVGRNALHRGNATCDL